MINDNIFLKCFLILFLFAATSWGSLTQAAHTSPHPYGITGYLGGTTTQINPSRLEFPLETDSLVPQTNPTNNLSWGVGVAYFTEPPNILTLDTLFHDVSIGLDLFNFTTNQPGEVWQYQLPEFNNYHYHLSVHSTRLLVTSEWTLKSVYKNILPFIEGGIGFVNNYLSFSEWPTINQAGTGFILKKNGQYKFSYTLGAGIKLPLTEKIVLSFRYLYTDLSKATSTNTPDNLLVSPITTSLWTQAWLAALTYQF